MKDGSTARERDDLGGPAAGKATAEELRRALRLHLDEPGMTQTAVAKAMDRSGAALSQWLRGEYKGDNEAVEAAVRSYLETAGKRAAIQARAPSGEFVRTSVADQVLRVCEWAHMYRTIGVVYGEAGMGKTMGAREYRRHHPETALVTCDPFFARTSALLDGMGRAVLGKDVSQKFAPPPHRLLRDLVEALRDSGRLLIVDEAQFLKREGVEVLRSLHDAAGIGVVVCGNYDVFQRMQGTAGAAVFAQVFSRVGVRRRITLSATRDDVKSLVGDLAGPAVTYLLHRAKEPGGFRRMDQIWRMAMEFAQARGQDVAIEDLEMAEACLFGSAGAA